MKTTKSSVSSLREIEKMPVLTVYPEAIESGPHAMNASKKLTSADMWQLQRNSRSASDHFRKWSLN